MPDCCVINCDRKKSVPGTYQSFKFPTDPCLKKQWVEAVMREKKSFIIDDGKVICKRHFTEDVLLPDFDKQNRPLKRVRLKEGAVPTLLMGLESKPKVANPRETRKSIDTLTLEKNKLEREVKRLTTENQLLKDTVKERDSVIEKLKCDLLVKTAKDEDETNELKEVESVFTGNLQKLFTEDMLKRLKYPDKRVWKWSDATLRVCITFYLICGKSAYLYLISKGFPFVPIRTLQTHMSNVNFDPSILKDIFILLKYKLDDLPAHHRNFGIVMDEMSINPKLEFDIGNQCLIGRPNIPLNPKTVAKKKAKDPDFDESKCLATHAMNIMLCGLCKRLKQIIAWFLTYSSFDPDYFAGILKEIVVMSHDIGANILAITIDMSGQNQKI